MKSIADVYIQEGMEKGKTKWLQEGRLEGAKLVARNLLKVNMDIHEISKATGLPLKEVIALKDKKY